MSDLSRMTDDEVLRAWIVAMHCWFCTKSEGWEQERTVALEELHRRKLGLKMLEAKL